MCSFLHQQPASGVQPKPCVACYKICPVARSWQLRSRSLRSGSRPHLSLRLSKLKVLISYVSVDLYARFSGLYTSRVRSSRYQWKRTAWMQETVRRETHSLPHTLPRIVSVLLF